MDFPPLLRPLLPRDVAPAPRQRSRIAFRCSEQARWLDAGDRTELIAQRVADADPLAGKANDDRADLVVCIALVAAHAGRRADAVAHAVHTELGPALAPQIRRHVRAIDRAQHVRDFPDPRRDAAMRFANVDRLDLEIARHRAADTARLIEIDAEVVADDRSEERRV